MGADGGIIGLKLKVSTSQELFDAIPEELLTWDLPDISSEEYSELPNWLYSTYGSFQTWDLGNLHEMVEEAKEYLTKNPNSTFRDWVEDIYTDPCKTYTHPISMFVPVMEKFLSEKYLGKSRIESDCFLDTKISNWCLCLEKYIDFSCSPDYQETWT